MAVDFDALCNRTANKVFGESFDYTPAGGVNQTVAGVFAKPYRHQVMGAAEVQWTTAAPSVGLRIADLPAAPAVGDRLVRKKTGVAYSVCDVRPDGNGWVHLPLKVMR